MKIEKINYMYLNMLAEDINMFICQKGITDKLLLEFIEDINLLNATDVDLHYHVITAKLEFVRNNMSRIAK